MLDQCKECGWSRFIGVCSMADAHSTTANCCVRWDDGTPIIAAGRYRPIVDKVFPLKEASDAHRRMEAGEHFGKIILAISG